MPGADIIRNAGIIRGRVLNYMRKYFNPYFYLFRMTMTKNGMIQSKFHFSGIKEGSTIFNAPHLKEMFSCPVVQIKKLEFIPYFIPMPQFMLFL